MLKQNRIDLQIQRKIIKSVLGICVFLVDCICGNDHNLTMSFSEKENRTKTLRSAFIATIPVMTGYLVMGAAFGILLASNGYGPWWALLICGLLYSGSMQFVAVSLLSTGASLITAALMTLLVNGRHLLYGISLLDKYKGMGKAKPYMIFSLTDETYALQCAEIPEGVEEKPYRIAMSVLNQLYWVVGGVAGACIGSAITFNTQGIDFAMTALFVVIVCQQWMQTEDHFPTLLGLGLTAVCLVLFGTEKFLIITMILLVLILYARPYLEKRRNPHE